MNHPFFPNRRPPQNEGFLSHFRTKDGEFDLDKIIGAAYQVKEAYDQISPLLTKFIKKK